MEWGVFVVVIKMFGLETTNIPKNRNGNIC